MGSVRSRALIEAVHRRYGRNAAQRHVTARQMPRHVVAAFLADSAGKARHVGQVNPKCQRNRGAVEWLDAGVSVRRLRALDAEA